jgi:hypothetical protein
LLLNAAETVLGYFGFDGSVYKSENKGIRSSKHKKWGGMNWEKKE